MPLMFKRDLCNQVSNSIQVNYYCFCDGVHVHVHVYYIATTMCVWVLKEWCFDLHTWHAQYTWYKVLHTGILVCTPRRALWVERSWHLSTAPLLEAPPLTWDEQWWEKDHHLPLPLSCLELYVLLPPLLSCHPHLFADPELLEPETTCRIWPQNQYFSEESYAIKEDNHLLKCIMNSELNLSLCLTPSLTCSLTHSVTHTHTHTYIYTYI